MGSYLDISIERQLDDGTWVNFMNCSSDDALMTVNLYKLRDVFNDCEHYDGEATIHDISKESASNFAIKIRQKNNYFGNIREGSASWPYDKRRNTVTAQNVDIMKFLSALEESLDTKFCSISLYVGGKERLYDTPYTAIQDLKYSPEYKGKVDELFDHKVCVHRYYNGQNEIVQYQMPSHTFISSYANLKAFERELVKELKQAEQTQSDENRLRALLISETSELKPEDMKGPLGDIVKRITKSRKWSAYTKSYIEELQDNLEELRFLIRLTGENGRIIWGIS